MVSEFRMTVQTLRILSVMLQNPEEDWYGLQLCRATAIKPGTAYPILLRLLQAGWLTRHEERIDSSAAKRPARALYRFTPDGLEKAQLALDEHLAALPSRSQPSAVRLRLSPQPT